MKNIKKLPIKASFSKCLLACSSCCGKFLSFIKKTKTSFLAGLSEFMQSKAGKVLRHSFYPLVIIIAIAQIVFAILIYGFKFDDKFTRSVAQIIPYPIAIVNYDAITYDEYLFERDYIHTFYKATEQEGIDYKVVDTQIVNQLVENKLIDYQAIINKIKVEKKEIDLAIDEIINQNGGQEQVEKVLKDLYGLSVKDFKKLVKQQILRDKINEKLIAKITASHILIRVEEGADEAAINAAKEKIVGIKNEIVNGLDFAEAAKKYSEDTGSAEQGGKLEPFAKGEMVEEFSNTAFKTPVGQISEPVKSDFGWHIILVHEKNGKIEERFADWLKSLEDKSLILKFYEV